jgi:hypothetical protein
MTDDEIMALANEYADVRFDLKGLNKEYDFDNIGVVNFARAIASKEREACIDIIAMNGGSVQIEAHIRQRGELDETT